MTRIQITGNISLVRLILLSYASVVVNLTRSADKYGSPCVIYSNRETQGVIRIKEISERFGNLCNGIPNSHIKIFRLVESDKSRQNLRLLLCTSAGSPEMMLQFKDTITNLISGQNTVQVQSCFHFSDVLIIKSNPGDKNSSLIITINQRLKTKKIGVLSILEYTGKVNRTNMMYDLRLTTDRKRNQKQILSTKATTDIQTKRIPSRIARNANPPPQHVTKSTEINSTIKQNSITTTDVNECGKTRGCFRHGVNSCQHFQCLYFLSYKVELDKQLDIELSGKSTGWIAIGFSFDKKMGNDDVIACIRSSMESDAIKLKAFSTSVPYKSPVEKPSLGKLQFSESRNGFIYCRLTIPINRTSLEQNTQYFDLNTKLYHLYAHGQVSSDGQILKHETVPMTSANKLSILNTNQNDKSLVLQSTDIPEDSSTYKPITKTYTELQKCLGASPVSIIKEDVEECGKTRGCFRYGSNSCGHFQCLYYFSYKVNEKKDKVDIELSGKTPGWIAVGFSSDNKMGGDDIIACVKKNPQSAVVRVKEFHSELPHQKPIEKPSYANLTSTESKDGFIYCRFVLLISRQSEEHIVDLSNDWYQLYARGPVSTTDGEILQHSEIPLTSASKFSIFRKVDQHRNKAASQNINNILSLLLFLILLNSYPA